MSLFPSPKALGAGHPHFAPKGPPTRYAGAIRTWRSTPNTGRSITPRGRIRGRGRKRLVSIINPLRGCNSDLAQYSNTPVPSPHLSRTRTITKRLERACRALAGGIHGNESGALIPGLHPRRSPETPQLRGRAVQFRPNTNSNTPTRDVTQILPACLR